MGAGRKIQTFSLGQESQGDSGTVNCSAKARNLWKDDLGGVIFGCTHETIAECLAKQIFGLPIQHFSYIKNIRLGLPLFLFNYSDRKLHGIFEAASNGKMNINPYGWSSDGSERTQYPAQVRMRMLMLYQPLSEKQYKPIIKENYSSDTHFRFELDHIQANQLIGLFQSSSANQSSVSGFSRNAPTWKPPPRRESEQVFQSVPHNNDAHSDHPEMVSGLPKNTFKWKDLFTSNHGHAVSNEDQGFIPSVPNTETVIQTQQHEGCLELSEPQFSPSTACVDEQSWNDQWSPSTNWVDEQTWENQLSPSTKCVDEQTWEDQLSLSTNCVDEQTLENQSNTPTDCADEQTLEDQSNTPTDCADEQILEDQSNTPTDCADEQTLEDQSNTPTDCADEQTWEDQSSTPSEWEDQLSTSTECADEKSWSDKMSPPTTCVDEHPWNDHAINETMMELLDEPKSGVHQLVFLIGGFNGVSCLSDLDCYSPSTDTIKSLNPMSLARSYASSATLNGEIYIFGGGDGYSWYDTVESYNALKNQWTSRPSLIEKKGSLAGVTLQNKIFAIGGGNGVESFSDIEMFDPALGNWIHTQSMLHKRFAPAATELNGVIYAVGGYDGNNYLKSAERFDPREVSCFRLRSMHTKRACHSLVALNEKLYALGGYDGTQMVPSVEVYDPRTGSWTAGEEMNKSRGYSNSAVIDNKIYVFGGMCQDNFLKTVECYTEGQGWEVTNLKGVGKRCLFAAAVL